MVQHQAAIGVHSVESHREELHDFARVVLVGLMAGRWIGLLVAHHAEVGAHHGAERDLLEQFAVIPKRVVQQQVVVARRAFVVDVERAKLGDDEDLAQRESHPLPELIGGGQRVLPPGLVAGRLPAVVAVPGFEFGASMLDVGEMMGRGQRHLRINPGAEGRGLHLCQVGLLRPKSRLGEETRGLSRVGAAGGGRGLEARVIRASAPSAGARTNRPSSSPEGVPVLAMRSHSR